MLRNEVGCDGAAPAVETTTNDNGLLNEFTESLSDPKTWLIGGAAAVAAAAAIKYGRPLLELGKSAVAPSDSALLAAIKEGSAGARSELPSIKPTVEALTESGIPIPKYIVRVPGTKDFVDLRTLGNVNPTKEIPALDDAVVASLPGRLVTNLDPRVGARLLAKHTTVTVEYIKNPPALSQAAMMPATDALVASAKPIAARDIGPLKIDPKIALDHAGFGGIPPIKSTDIASAIAHEVAHGRKFFTGIDATRLPKT